LLPSPLCSGERDWGRGASAMRIAIVAEVFLPKIDGVVNRTLNLIR
jgi:hypothetical protein